MIIAIIPYINENGISLGVLGRCNENEDLLCSLSNSTCKYMDHHNIDTLTYKLYKVYRKENIFYGKSKNKDIFYLIRDDPIDTLLIMRYDPPLEKDNLCMKFESQLNYENDNFDLNLIYHVFEGEIELGINIHEKIKRIYSFFGNDFSFWNTLFDKINYELGLEAVIQKLDILYQKVEQISKGI